MKVPVTAFRSACSPFPTAFPYCLSLLPFTMLPGFHSPLPFPSAPSPLYSLPFTGTPLSSPLLPISVSHCHFLDPPLPFPVLPVSFPHCHSPLLPTPFPHCCCPCSQPPFPTATSPCSQSPFPTAIPSAPSPHPTVIFHKPPLPFPLLPNNSICILPSPLLCPLFFSTKPLHSLFSIKLLPPPSPPLPISPWPSSHPPFLPHARVLPANVAHSSCIAL